MRIRSWTAVTLAAMSCGVAPVEAGTTATVVQAIRNGDPATAPAFSGVGLLSGAPDGRTCTGSLISPSLVLTAAQCVYGVAPGALTFSLPTVGGRTPRRQAAVTAAVPHPLFSTYDGINLIFDVALARLEKPRSRRWRDARRYPVATAGMPTRVHATVVGLGDSPLGPGRRTQGDVLVTQYIGSEGPVGIWVPDAFLELQPGTSADQMFCPGDAGGPLLYQGEIAGLASFRFVATCVEAGPGYAVSVPHHASWIAERLAELDPPGACATEDDASFATAGGGCQDLATGAVWSAPGEGEGDRGGCEGLDEGGQQDWRRPTHGERALLERHVRALQRGDHEDDEARPGPMPWRPRCVRAGDAGAVAPAGPR
jgi:hypothetical protein